MSQVSRIAIRRCSQNVFVFVFVNLFLVMSCLLITLSKCLKGHKSLGSLCNVKSKSILSEWLSHWVTRSPRHLFWTANKKETHLSHISLSSQLHHCPVWPEISDINDRSWNWRWSYGCKILRTRLQLISSSLGLQELASSSSMTRLMQRRLTTVWWRWRAASSTSMWTSTTCRSSPATTRS